MKVLFFSPSMVVNGGGVERHALEVAKRLAKNHEVTVVTEAKSSSTEDSSQTYHSQAISANEAKSEKSRVKSSHFIRKKIESVTILYFTFGGKNFIKKFVIWVRMIEIISLVSASDVIHCHDVFIWVLPLRVLFPFKKIYITFHGYEGYPITIKAKIIRKVSHILSNGSINVGRYIEKWYGTKPDYITYGAVDEEEFKGIRSNIPVKSAKPLKILFIGRLEEINSLPQYLKVLSELRKKRTNFMFKAFGIGSMEKETSKMGKVFTRRNSLKNLLKETNIVFSASYLSCMEGLISKRRVFCLYSEPVRKDCFEMAPFGKFVSLSGSIEEMADEIVEYVNAGKDEKLNSGYLWTKNQTWDKLTQLYLKLWKYEEKEKN